MADASAGRYSSAPQEEWVELSRSRGGRSALERRAAKLNRGDIFDVDWPGVGEHPAVVLTRQTAVPVLSADQRAATS